MQALRKSTTGHQGAMRTGQRTAAAQRAQRVISVNHAGGRGAATNAWWRVALGLQATSSNGAASSDVAVLTRSPDPEAVKPAVADKLVVDGYNPLTTEAVEAQFDLWNRRLQEGNPEKVADLYSDGAVLLATLSNEPRTTREARVDYFTSFLAKKPAGTILEKHVRIMKDPLGVTAVNSGTYCFKFGADGSSATARYTFLYRLEDGEWKITYHHSSLMPETLEDEITNTFAKWNSALQTGNPELVADLYAPDAVLLPTVSNVVRSDRAAIVDYFTAFLKRKPVGTVNVGYVLELGFNLAAYAGIYTFKFGDGSSAQARFSFKYARDPATGVWLIKDHHSSVLPEPKPFVAPSAAASN